MRYTLESEATDLDGNADGEIASYCLPAVARVCPLATATIAPVREFSLLDEDEIKTKIVHSSVDGRGTRLPGAPKKAGGAIALRRISDNLCVKAR